MGSNKAEMDLTLFKVTFGVEIGNWIFMAARGSTERGRSSNLISGKFGRDEE